MRIQWWKHERTWCITWGQRGIMIGLTGLDRPSLRWYLRVWRLMRRDKRRERRCLNQ